MMVPDDAQHKFRRNWMESIKQWLGTTMVYDVRKNSAGSTMMQIIIE